MRIPIKATAREPIKQAGYISATSAFHAQALLRNAAGPYKSAISDRYNAANRNHIHRTHVPVEEPSTASIAEVANELLATRTLRERDSTPGTLHQFISVLPYYTLMDERRAAPRKRVMKAGTIEFDGGAITCLVRDLSISGAALDVTSPVGIPEHFILAFHADGMHMPCRLIWRKENRIGVTFV